jgi:predicted small lipoprotein YifL
MKRALLLAALAATLAVTLAACGSTGPAVAPKTAARDAEEVTRLLPAIPLRLERCEFVEPENDKLYAKERLRYVREHRRLEEVAYRLAARTTGQSLAELRSTARTIAIARAEREFGGEFPSVEMCRTLLDACQSRNPERCPLVNVMAPDLVRTVMNATDQ